MSSINGVVVIDRLNAIQRSLSRAMDGVAREIENRDSDESYTDLYLSKLSALARRAAELEDEIRKELTYA